MSANYEPAPHMTSDPNRPRPEDLKGIGPNELRKLVEAHKAFATGRNGGRRLVLRFHDLSDVNLARAMLQEADFMGSRLQRAVLEEADLRNADLEGADLRSADVTQTNLSEARLRGAKLDQDCDTGAPAAAAAGKGD